MTPSSCRSAQATHWIMNVLIMDPDNRHSQDGESVGMHLDDTLRSDLFFTRFIAHQVTRG